MTLNDPQFVEAARILAERTLIEWGQSEPEARVDFLARRLLAAVDSESEETPNVAERPALRDGGTKLLTY